jgi:hypothetical protein
MRFLLRLRLRESCAVPYSPGPKLATELIVSHRCSYKSKRHSKSCAQQASSSPIRQFSAFVFLGMSIAHVTNRSMAKPGKEQAFNPQRRKIDRRRGIGDGKDL